MPKVKPRDAVPPVFNFGGVHPVGGTGIFGEVQPGGGISGFAAAMATAPQGCEAGKKADKITESVGYEQELNAIVEGLRSLGVPVVDVSALTFGKVPHIALSRMALSETLVGLTHDTLMASTHALSWPSLMSLSHGPHMASMRLAHMPLTCKPLTWSSLSHTWLPHGCHLHGTPRINGSISTPNDFLVFRCS